MFLNPYKAIQLVGKWEVQAVTLALPRDAVEYMISSEPCLGPHLRLTGQNHTPAGTHPVVFLFGTHYRARLTFPWVFPPPMTYDEMVVMVPYVKPRGALSRTAPHGPLVFMPRLFLSQLLPTFGGWFFWGFNKKLARIAYRMRQKGEEAEGVVHGNYSVRSMPLGAPLVSLDWSVGKKEAWVPVEGTGWFDLAREIHEQPLLGQLPGTVGPILGYAYWNKFWEQGRVRPIHGAKVNVTAPFIAGLDMGQYSSGPISKEQPLGAYQLRVPWALELPRIEQLVSGTKALWAGGRGEDSWEVHSGGPMSRKRGESSGWLYLDEGYSAS